MAAFSFDVQIPPASVNVRDVAPGYGVLSVPVTGLLTSDIVPQMRLAITPNGGSVVEFTITPQALASGQLVAGNDLTTRVGQFSLDPTTVALIASAGKATYSVRLWVTRAGVTQDREIQAGGMTARVASVSRSLNTVTTVTVTPGTVAAVPGSTPQLSVAATDALGNPVTGQVFTWVSSNPAVATVDQTGKVTVLASGTAVLSATVQGVAGVSTVTVTGFAAPSEGVVPTYRSGAWTSENPDTRYDTQWGWNQAAGAGLNYAYKGGAAFSSVGVVANIAGGSVALAANATNYVERSITGVVSANTTGFSPAKLSMAVVTTGAAGISSVVDQRNGMLGYYAPAGSEIGVVDPRFPRGDARRHGVIGDGAMHPLSGTYGSLAAAQAVYPFVTALTQQLDWAAIQACSNSALGWNGSENALTQKDIPVILPAGNFQLGADTWLVRNAVGARIEGAGRLQTSLTSTGVVFATDGFWFSQLRGMAFIGSSGAAPCVVDIDGNVPGHPYATRGVQGNTFADCWFDGSTVVTLGFALTRQGNQPGPGAQGSENLFLNCHFNNCTTANWYSNGYNALQNTFVGGNFQGHKTHGIQLNAGAVFLYSVGFQSTNYYEQIANDGYDINANAAGAYDRIIIDGCRSESLRFVRINAASQTPAIRGCNVTPGGINDWPANYSNFTLNAIVRGQIANGEYRLFRLTTTGTTGATVPTWPATGTVTDGTCVWTEFEVATVDLATGELAHSVFGDGLQVLVSGNRANVRDCMFNRADYRYAGSVATALYERNYTSPAVGGGRANLSLDTTGGDVTFTSAATKAVTFVVPERDTNYTILFDPGVGETMWATSKTVNGFTANSSNATSVAAAKWQLVRA